MIFKVKSLEEETHENFYPSPTFHSVSAEGS